MSYPYKLPLPSEVTSEKLEKITNPDPILALKTEVLPPIAALLASKNLMSHLPLYLPKIISKHQHVRCPTPGTSVSLYGPFVEEMGERVSLGEGSGAYWLSPNGLSRFTIEMSCSHLGDVRGAVIGKKHQKTESDSGSDGETSGEAGYKWTCFSRLLKMRISDKALFDMDRPFVARDFLRGLAVSSPGLEFQQLKEVDGTEVVSKRLDECLRSELPFGTLRVTIEDEEIRCSAKGSWQHQLWETVAAVCSKSGYTMPRRLFIIVKERGFHTSIHLDFPWPIATLYFQVAGLARVNVLPLREGFALMRNGKKELTRSQRLEEFKKLGCPLRTGITLFRESHGNITFRCS